MKNYDTQLYMEWESRASLSNTTWLIKLKPGTF